MDKTKLVKYIFDKHAAAYQDRFMDVSLYHDSLDIFCNALQKQDAAILELACGPGNITRYLLNKRPNLTILGVDLSENMIALARQNCPEAVFEVMDCRDIGNLEKKYNGVIAGFCFPYLSREEVVIVIGDASSLLIPSGVLYISTMEDDYATSGWRTSSTGDKVYMYNHEEGYLTAALEKSNFKIIDLQRKEYPGRDGEKVVDLIITAILQK
ncbi:methyltransferase domain-containing protein [Flavobacterium sp. DGU11]|uniref:Methyltransferase domain-containing protein n=1 Tax=Flavobacterium arundinis TaxID=3139143 RepID=A0ABU9HV01_9FLAO